MAELKPLRGVRYDVSRVELGTVLAPPYDVIDTNLRAELYSRDPRNIVRVDLGKDEPGDQEGVADRHSRAGALLNSWLGDGTLVRDLREAVYVTDHEFPLPDGGRARRRGIFGRLPALPWDAASIRPHERTLSGPKRDRLALMRASGMQTSAVFGVWDGAPDMAPWLHDATYGPADAEASFPGELGEERVRLWVVAEPARCAAVQAALAGAQLYIADGHHRYETAAAYAAERRAAEAGAPPDADFGFCLVHLCAADDPGLVLLPTHRLVPLRPGVPRTLSELSAGLDGGFDLSVHRDLDTASAALRGRPRTEHAMVLVLSDAVALLSCKFDANASPRAQLDVSVLEEQLLRPWGLTGAEISAGALSYERDAAVVADIVAAGRAAMGIVLRACSVGQMLAVAAAGETMPQKSTYFYPKVPTGLVISPL